MNVLALLLLAQAARAQYELKQDDGIDVLTTPMHGEACGYASCLPVKPGWLNIHIVPQTHSELGHTYNFHQHFTGEDPPFPKNNVNMKRILDAILTQLWNDSNRRFTLSDTAYLFHWWKNRHPAVHRMMYELIRTGRLTIVGGGLGVSDEASTSYHAIIDHYTYSLRKLNATFRACARPLVAWAADVYGHSREFTSLMAQMGYDALFINPISYDEEIARMRRKSLEFLWRGSDDLGPVTDLFTHNLFDGYWAPPGFCFSKLCSDPLLVTSSRLFSEVTERVDKFIEGMLYRQAPNFETRNVMVIMGHRKAYADADVWFTNIEKLIAFTNWRAMQKKMNITLFYSNPPCYLAAVHDEKPELETKQDDFFPYVHDKDSYTVGMYTSRPTFKYFIREAQIYLQIAKQIQVTANMGPYTNLFEDFNWVMGVVQDHSIAPGVLQHRVKDYYTGRIDSALGNASVLISRGFTKLRSSPRPLSYYRCQFNISSCYGTRYIKYSIVVYNPLGWPVTMPVRLPIYPTNSQYKVYDHKGEEVKSVTIKLPNTILRIKGRAKADHELVFIATSIPPVGFRSYYIEALFFKSKIRTKKTDYDYEQADETTMLPVWKELGDIPSYNKYQGKVLGSDTKKRRKKMINATEDNAQDKLDTNASKNLTTEVLKGKFNNYMRNVIHVDDDTKEETGTRESNIHVAILREATTESDIMLPMLRNFLQNNKILTKLNYINSEKDLLSSNELKNAEITTENEFGAHSFEPDIKIPFGKKDDDIMVDTDIRVPIRRPVKGSNVQKPDRINPYFRAPVKTTTEQDIRVFTPVRVDPDMRVVVNADIQVPMNRRKAKTKPSKEKNETVDIEPARTERLEIMPVRTTSTSSTTGTNWFTTTESVLVVPVSKTWDTMTLPPYVKLENTLEPEANINEEIVSTTENSINVTPFDVKRHFEIPEMYKSESEANPEFVSDTDALINDVGRNEDIEQMENAERFRVYSLTTEGTELFTNTTFRAYLETDQAGQRFIENYKNITKTTEQVETTDETETTTDIETTTVEFTTSNDMVGSTVADDGNMFLEAPMTRKPTIATTVGYYNKKYFRVTDGSRLFIGNKYIRVNLNKNRRIASIFLRNGVRINLEILMFHYVSDDPSKFDIRTVPRREIKPPGAYIFRPIDPYIIRSEDNYDVNIVKTDVVEEIHITFSNWTSLQMRLYVDSPVIEVHWLVGPIPTEDGLGKEVFIRYKTDLDHEDAFYTDSNGRQTIKRIRGTRATYDPVDLDPITGNLYPVTSKIYIEDLSKDIRFAVFNDRCQAGGALIDGAIDLMLHRRILTDDIGFGAYLNETENDEPIRVAGTHYLYLTKASRNRIFEKKFAKEIALAPRVLTSDHSLYNDNMKKQFYDAENEFSALNDKLPLGVHLLTLERISAEEILVRLENYLEKVDVSADGVRYVPLRDLLKDIKIVWLKETTLAGNMFKDQWTPTQWRKKNLFYRRFNDYYGNENSTLEEEIETVPDELGGRGIRLAPQQIRTFIARIKHSK